MSSLNCKLKRKRISIVLGIAMACIPIWCSVVVDGASSCNRHSDNVLNLFAVPNGTLRKQHQFYVTTMRCDIALNGQHNDRMLSVYSVGDDRMESERAIELQEVYHSEI